MCDGVYQSECAASLLEVMVWPYQSLTTPHSHHRRAPDPKQPNCGSKDDGGGDPIGQAASGHRGKTSTAGQRRSDGPCVSSPGVSRQRPCRPALAARDAQHALDGRHIGIVAAAGDDDWSVAGDAPRSWGRIRSSPPRPAPGADPGMHRIGPFQPGLAGRRRCAGSPRHSPRECRGCAGARS